MPLFAARVFWRGLQRRPENFDCRH
jgi:hypothetical protein